MPIALAFMLICGNAKSNDLTPLDTSGIQDQFNYIIKKSTKYNDYKVVKATSLKSLQSNVLDSLNGLKTNLLTTELNLTKELALVASLKIDLAASKEALAEVSKSKDSMILFGASITKSAYKSIMWTACAVLLALFIFASLILQKSNSARKRIKADLEELKIELENNRRRSREREEKIVRKLHDEINKYKKRVYQLEKSSTKS